MNEFQHFDGMVYVDEEGILHRMTPPSQRPFGVALEDSIPNPDGTYTTRIVRPGTVTSLPPAPRLTWWQRIQRWWRGQ